jgi:uncharacterized Ntn-hydrolase superfamily protein
VGSIVSWGEAGLGTIATQSFVNVSFGPRGLNLLRKGKSAEEVVDNLISSDEGRDVRQLAVVDAKGRVAAYTGKGCIPEACHIIGDQFSVQANMMLRQGVCHAMAKAFQKAEGPLAERLVAALEAAQSAGGDIRGQQSASLLIVRGIPTGKIWEDRFIDLRVEDHPQAVLEIKRLLKVFRAYEYMNQGDLAMEKDDVSGALNAYGAAEKMFPDHLEMRYWHAIALANIGNIEKALPLFKSVFQKEANWRILTQRLPQVKLLNVDSKDLKIILSQ